MNPQAPEFTVHNLPRATPKSAGLDLAVDKDYLLSLWDGVHLLETSVKGKLPKGTFGLIIKRSSNYTQHFEIVPGVVDADTQATIKIMVKPLKETVQLHKGQRIAQLVIMPYLQLPNPVLTKERGTGQFGSTNHIAWVQEISMNRPFKTIKLNGKTFKGLLDTGADRTCITANNWPSTWPVHKTTSTLQGLGTSTNVAQSAQILKWESEGQSGYVQPYVITSLPFSLWGRDIMGDMQLKLVTSDNLNEQHFS